jgi:predicted RNA-binding Zn-ribbon protein involved in translation (DUF1610 family)
MTSKDPIDGIQLHLVHVHVCDHCGHARRREDVDSREIGSGILHCPQCNHDGPLNVEIRDSPGISRKP